MDHHTITSKCASFVAKRNTYLLSKYKECLEKYSTNLEAAIALKTKSPIFLDTNILLRYYSISFAARDKLFNFIQSNKSRIIITAQVQREFIKNREDVIQRFFEQVSNKIPKDFNSDVVNKMKSFLDTHKVVLKDYPFVEEGINKHKTELEEILRKLNDTVESKRKEISNLLVKDKFLDLLNSCNLYEGLAPQEIDILKKDFDNLSKAVPLENIESILNNNANAVFPGLGDIKQKPDDPYGDFIIYHEMMKYMLNEKVDAIFLTFDNTKGDWLSKSKAPHLHYTQNMYANTGQLLYILDGERMLEETLNIDIESLVKSFSEESSDLINVDSLKRLGSRLPMMNGRDDFDELFVKELLLNHISSIKQLEMLMNLTAEAFKIYQDKKGIRYSFKGQTRFALKLMSKEYKQIRDNGEVVTFKEEDLRKFHSYNRFLDF